MWPSYREWLSEDFAVFREHDTACSRSVNLLEIRLNACWPHASGGRTQRDSDTPGLCREKCRRLQRIQSQTAVNK